MPTPTIIEGMLVKVESAYGTDPTPSNSADGVRVSSKILSQMSTEFRFPQRRPNVVTGTLLPIAPGGRKGRVVTLDLFVEVKGAGLAYASGSVVPEMDVLLLACGHSRVHVDTGGSETVTYAPADSSHDSCTIWAYGAGNVHKIVGCRGNLLWDIEPGMRGTLHFRMQGMMVSDPAVAALPSVTYDAVIPPAAVGMTYTLGGWTPDLVRSSFDAGVNVVELEDATAADGIEGYFISAQVPTLTLEARQVALATYDPYAAAQDATASTLSIILGSTQYNKLTLQNTSLSYLMDVKDTDNNDFDAWSIEVEMTGYSLVFD